MPSPTPICPAGTVNKGSRAPGSVQPRNATPNETVLALARRARRSTSLMSPPASAAAPATLKTKTSPATPRRSAGVSAAGRVPNEAGIGETEPTQRVFGEALGIVIQIGHESGFLPFLRRLAIIGRRHVRGNHGSVRGRCESHARRAERTLSTIAI